MALDNNHITKLGELKQLIDGLWGKVTTAISNAVSGLLSKSEADAAYQAKGSYATQSELNSLGSSLSGSISSINSKIPSDASETNKLATAADIPDVPTNVSAFENDAGYITSETDPVFSASAAAGITSSDIDRWNGKEVVYITSSNTSYSGITNILNADKLPVLVNNYQAQGRTFRKNLYLDVQRLYSGSIYIFTNVSNLAFVPDSFQTEIITEGCMLFVATIGDDNVWNYSKKSLLTSNGRPQFPAGSFRNPIFFNSLGEPTPTNWEFSWWSAANRTINVSDLPLSRSFLFFNTNSSSSSNITINNDTNKAVTVTNLSKSGTASTLTINSLASSVVGGIKKCGGMGLIIRQNETSLIVIREV